MAKNFWYPLETVEDQGDWANKSSGSLSLSLNPKEVNALTYQVNIKEASGP